MKRYKVTLIYLAIQLGVVFLGCLLAYQNAMIKQSYHAAHKKLYGEAVLYVVLGGAAAVLALLHFAQKERKLLYLSHGISLLFLAVLLLLEAFAPLAWANAAIAFSFGRNIVFLFLGLNAVLLAVSLLRKQKNA